MKTTLSAKEIAEYTITQMAHFFPDDVKINKKMIQKAVDAALERVEYCFSKINVKYYVSGSEVFFDHLNGDQYAVFLYMLSRAIFESDDVVAAKKIYLLNKALHSIDAFYEIQLPSIFIFVHPLGTVLGRAQYADYLAIYQGCTVGGNREYYPEIGQYVTLHPGATVLGKSKIGNSCSIGAGALMLDTVLKDNSVYVGNPKSNFIFEKNVQDRTWK